MTTGDSRPSPALQEAERCAELLQWDLSGLQEEALRIEAATGELPSWARRVRRATTPE